MINPKQLAQKIVLTFFLFSIFFVISGFHAQTPIVRADVCGYSFPATVASGSSFNVSVSGTPGHTFQAGIVDSSSNLVGGSGSATMPTSGPLSITVTAPNPPINGPFRLLASDLTAGPPPCIATDMTISIAGSTSGTSGGSAECANFSDCTTIPGVPTPPGYTADNFITKLVSDILPIAIGIGGFLSVIIVIVSGIQFITSNGNPEGAAAARGRLTFALVGFVLLILAFAITKVIDSVFLLSGTV